MTSGRTAGVWERRAWAAGVVFVVAVLAKTAISAGLPINLHSLVLVGGVLLVALHAASDIGIYGSGSVFLITAGLLLIRTRVLPGWLAWTAVTGGAFVVAGVDVWDAFQPGLIGGVAK